MPLLAFRSLYEAAEVVVVPPVPEELVIGGPRYDWPREVEVYLTGVAASPEVGEITVYDTSRVPRLYPYPEPQAPARLPRTAPRRKPVEIPEQPPPEPVVVTLTGITTVSAVGTGTVKTVFELLDDEIITLLEAA